MNRCPQCNFLYLDSDRLCDLDGTALVRDDGYIDGGAFALSEAVEQGTAMAARRHARRPRLNWRILTTATVTGLLVTLALFLAYQSATRSTLQARQASPDTMQKPQDPSANDSADRQQDPPLFSSAPSPVATGSTTANGAPTPAAKASALARADSTRLPVSSNPVSTGGTAKGGRGPVVIRLTDGSSLQADEVWKTRAGVWYRRKGIVTLLKPGRVRAMENQPN